MNSAAVFHSSNTGEHFTPGFIADAAREVLGGIDLDPVSCAEANETIRADRFFAAEDDGLAKPWRGSVFLNPPGTCGLTVCGNAKVCSCALVRRFWAKLVAGYATGDVTRAIWVGFSVQQLQVLQGVRFHPLCFPVCYPRKRIAYSGDSPPHASYVAYLGGGIETLRFEDVFGKLGHVVTPDRGMTARVGGVR